VRALCLLDHSFLIIFIQISFRRTNGWERSRSLTLPCVLIAVSASSLYSCRFPDFHHQQEPEESPEEYAARLKMAREEQEAAETRRNNEAKHRKAMAEDERAKRKCYSVEPCTSSNYCIIAQNGRLLRNVRKQRPKKNAHNRKPNKSKRKR